MGSEEHRLVASDPSGAEPGTGGGYCRSAGLRLPAAALLFLLATAPGFGVDGTFVLAGRPRPAAQALRVFGGRTVKLDLLVDAPLPAENRCVTVLYALGGPLAVKVSEQTGPLVTESAREGGYRASLNLAIPAAKPGARFLLRTEFIAPTRRLLAARELRIPESDPVADVRAGFSNRRVQVAGPSPRLRELFQNWQIPFSDEPDPLPTALVFTEDAAEARPGPAAAGGMLVRILAGNAEGLILTARNRGGGWVVTARLPHAPDLSDPEASEWFAQILRYVAELESLD